MVVVSLHARAPSGGRRPTHGGCFGAASALSKLRNFILRKPFFSEKAFQNINIAKYTRTEGAVLEGWFRDEEGGQDARKYNNIEMTTVNRTAHSHWLHSSLHTKVGNGFFSRNNTITANSPPTYVPI